MGGLGSGRRKKVDARLAEQATELVMTEAHQRQLLLEYQLLEKEIGRRRHILDPRTYGLPDLLFKPAAGETPDAFKERQNKALGAFITDGLKFKKDGRFRPVIIIPEMLDFIADLFFRRVQNAILWKPRGSGGSLAAGILIWLTNVYLRRSFVNIAGSAEQAMPVYDYVCGFWDSMPEMKAKMLNGDPLAMSLKLMNGVYMKCITGSEKAARGKHPSCLMIDEASQRDEKTNVALEAAMQTPMSEKDRMIILVSTFHVPTGMFQAHWDLAEEKGFKRYKWTIFRTMSKCVRGMELATADDPKALAYCRGEAPGTEMCELSRTVPVRDRYGQVIRNEFRGCNGQARDTRGFQSFEQVLTAKRANAGTSTFFIEYECFPGDTLVTTIGGPKPISTIVVGDEVLTDDGQFRRVKDVMSRPYEGQLVGIRVRGHETVWMTPEHPVLATPRPLARKRGGRREWRPGYCTDYFPAHKINDGAYLKCPLPEGFERPVGLEVDHLTAWALGLLVGDGHASSASICLSWNKEEVEMRKRYEEFVHRLGKKVSENIQVSSDKVLNLRFHDTVFARWFRSQFYSGKDKTIPPWVYQLPPGVIYEFLCGWNDADGCYDTKWSRSRLSTRQRDLAYAAIDLYARVGARAVLGIHTQNKDSYAAGRKQYTVEVAERQDWTSNRCVIKTSRKRFKGEVFNLSVEGNPTYALPQFVVHNCERPEFGTNVYPLNKIDRCVHLCELDSERRPFIEWGRRSPKSIGLDWGLHETAIVLLSLEKERGYVGVLEYLQLSGKLVPEIERILESFHDKYSDDGTPIPVYADASHPYNNHDLIERGFEVVDVHFQKYKDLGIGNVSRYLEFERLRILPDWVPLIRQLKAYRFNKEGKPVKQDDHGPDATLAGLLHFRFDETFPEDILVTTKVDRSGEGDTGEVLEF
jgi:hypothetical protein